MDKINLQNLAIDWASSGRITEIPVEYYCLSQDIFHARLDNMIQDLLANKSLSENNVYMLGAIVGEIGNNSFDHNIGNWPNVPGIFFGWQVNGKIEIILADRGQGVMATLKKVKPEISNDQEALKTAFFEKISGRAPEARGNGLKFVRQGLKEMNAHLVFISGNAKARLNQDFTIDQTDNHIQGCFAAINL